MVTSLLLPQRQISCSSGGIGSAPSAIVIDQEEDGNEGWCSCAIAAPSSSWMTMMVLEGATDTAACPLLPPIPFIVQEQNDNNKNETAVALPPSVCPF